MASRESYLCERDASSKALRQRSRRKLPTGSEGVILAPPVGMCILAVDFGSVSPYLQAVNHVQLRLRLKAEGHEP